MKRSKGEVIIHKIAKQNGVSEKKIREQIQLAIDLAMANPDPTKRAYWQNMFRKGVKPSPEEVIFYIADQVKKKE